MANLVLIEGYKYLDYRELELQRNETLTDKDSSYQIVVAKVEGLEISLPLHLHKKGRRFCVINQGDAAFYLESWKVGPKERVEIVNLGNKWVRIDAAEVN